MSCQFGWGCESEDANSLSMNKIQAAENSHLKDHAASTNTFIVYMRVSKSLVDTCNTGHAQKFKIDSDYEPSSAIQIARYLHDRLQSTCVIIPSLSSLYFRVISKTNNEALIVKMCKQLNYSVSLATKYDEATEDSDYARQHVLASALHHLMQQSGYSAFALEDQIHGVLAKPVASECQLLDVIALRNCVLNNRSKILRCMEDFALKVLIDEVYLTVECFCYRTSPFNPTKDSGNQSAIFMPTMEPVTVLQVLSSSSPTSSSSTTGTTAYLTDYDQQCRVRGYNQYLPDRAEAFSLYWSLLYGVHWREGDPVAHVRGEGTGVAALGDRVVPLSTLCRGASEVPSKTKQYAADIVHRFISALSSVPHLSDARIHTPERLTSQLTNRVGSGFKAPSLKKAVPQGDGEDDLFFGESMVSVNPRKKAKK